MVNITEAEKLEKFLIIKKMLIKGNSYSEIKNTAKCGSDKIREVKTQLINDGTLIDKPNGSEPNRSEPNKNIKKNEFFEDLDLDDEIPIPKTFQEEFSWFESADEFWEYMKTREPKNNPAVRRFLQYNRTSPMDNALVLFLGFLNKNGYKIVKGAN